MIRPIFLLTLTAGLMGLSGCGGWLARESVPTTTPPTITIRDIRPVGTPLVTIQTTPFGWQVSARQPIERDEVEERPVTERVQRMLFFPPAIFPGLIQCPIGSLTRLFTAGKYGHDLSTNGCWRLIMIEPLPGTATMSTDVARTTRTVPDSEPLRGASVQLTQQDNTREWTGGLDLNGTILIPYESVSAQQTSAPLATLTIHRQQGALWRGALPNRPSTIDAAPLQREWPTTLVYQIEETSPRDARLQQLLQHELLGLGYCVVAGASIRDQLRNEVFIQEAGYTTDTATPGALDWIPATVLVRMASDQVAGTDVVQISWIDVEHGRVLDTEILPTSVTVGQQSAQIRRMMQQRLPSQRGCEKRKTGPMQTTERRSQSKP